MTPIVYLTHRDPLVEAAGGAPFYLRAHARAALVLGFEPHIFAISAHDSVTATDFGFVHHVGAQLSQFRFAMQPELKDLQTLWHLPRLKSAARRFILAHPKVSLIHSFAQVAGVGADLSAEFGPHGRHLNFIASAFTTRLHAARARLHSAPGYSLASRLRYRTFYLWVRAIVDRIEGRGYRRSQLILCNYESVRRLLLESYARLPDIRKIPYTSESAFLDEREFSELPSAIDDLSCKEAPLLVSVSRHDARKGIDVFIRALSILRDRGIAFRACLVGPGPLKGTHSELVALYNLGGRVVITGYVPEPGPYLAAGDVYVLPSREEGSGSVALIEAMQAGLCPVASDVDGLPEDIRHMENGLLVRPGDPQALALALERVILDCELRKKLGAGARRTFEQRFSRSALIDALGEIYEEFGSSSKAVFCAPHPEF